MKQSGSAKNEANNAAQAASKIEEAFSGFFPGCKCSECHSAEACKAAFAENMGAAGADCAGIASTENIDFSNVVIEPLFEEAVDFDTFSKSDFRAVKVLECQAVPKSKKH